MTEHDSKKAEKHKRIMQKQKQQVDAGIQKATIQKGIVILITGNGKGKTTSAFGMVMRSLGYGHRVGIVQFIKGTQLSGEEVFIKEHYPNLLFYQMNTGFTWDTQDRDADIAAATKVWQHAKAMLSDETLRLVVLDELTYMLAFTYLDEQAVISAIKNRPPEQSVIITGRGGGKALRELADTVSDVQEIKHAYNEGIEARKGVDW